MRQYDSIKNLSKCFKYVLCVVLPLICHVKIPWSICALMIFFVSYYLVNIIEQQIFTHMVISDCLPFIPHYDLLAPFKTIFIHINLLALIPFFIAFYYFYYRQQRSISESLIIKNNTSFFMVLYTSFVIWSIIWHPDISGDITLGQLICLISSIIWGGYFIQFVFKRLKVKRIIIETCSEIRKLLHVLKCLYWGNFIENILFEDLMWKFEILFQVLYYTVSKKINIIYESSLSQMKSSICLLNVMLLNSVKFAQQNEISNSSSLLYNHILKRYVQLCILLYDNQQYSEFEKTVDTLFEFYPEQIAKMQDDSFMAILDEFFYSFWVIGIYLSSRNRSDFQNFVKKVERICLPGQERLEFCVFFKALLVKAVENDDLKFLTELCYLQKLFLDSIVDINEKKLPGYKSEDFQKKIGLTIVNAIQDLKTKSYYEGILLYALLQAAVKTIELGLYGQTGFLVKYIVSNYKTSELQIVIYHLINHEVYKDEKLNSMCLTKKLKVYFSINPQTAWYCMKKLILLLRAQQLFRFQSSSDKKKILDFDIVSDKAQEFDKQYCIDKIINVGDSYGMLAINRKWFR